MAYKTWQLTEQGVVSLVVMDDTNIVSARFFRGNAAARAMEAEVELASGRNPSSIECDSKTIIAYRDVAKMAVQEDGQYLQIESRPSPYAAPGSSPLRVALCAENHQGAMELARAIMEKIEVVESREPISLKEALMVPAYAMFMTVLTGLGLFASALGEPSSIQKYRRWGLTGQWLGPTGVVIVTTVVLVLCGAWAFNQAEDRTMQIVWTPK